MYPFSFFSTFDSKKYLIAYTSIILLYKITQDLHLRLLTLNIVTKNAEKENIYFFLRENGIYITHVIKVHSETISPARKAAGPA